MPSRQWSGAFTGVDFRRGQRRMNMLSTRNKFPGTIKAMNVGQIMAEVIISVGEFEIVSLISRESARRMGLKVGDKVSALIKSTEVTIDK